MKTKFYMAMGTALVSVFGLAFLFIKTDEICKKRSFRKNVEKKITAEDNSEVSVRGKKTQERYSCPERKQETYNFQEPAVERRQGDISGLDIA